MDNRVETRRFRYCSFDLELQFQGPRGILRVQAPGGLYGMLPVEKEPDATGTYRLADGLEDRRILRNSDGSVSKMKSNRPRCPAMASEPVETTTSSTQSSRMSMSSSMTLGRPPWLP
ncbi:hypothetical protein ACGF5O_47335 [Streptomyces sp. NPDC048291]|uniref:hypothetical protein n=1 Tax=Streptomyces sp. NPDC048291 TaxID=3365530 RepID=UPI0037128A30